ncbi:MAG: RNA-binding domain-containing protein [Flavobacterium sp.]|jgi:ATP-dependent DNA helicase RecG|uniref:RNA-binding domain-containing protein n=1 Tax=Flavobacterium sp. TaxID=239 RepID=UPI0022BF1AA6|nr:RNA-binding domain-containing protein [Flavobacterium sp.]MCZ8297751.1 putative DNA binding domain-containing protein [Flavobacterium sp.]
MEDNLIISTLLKQHEGERLEFKSSINKNSIAEVITSFINTKGGDLLIGINDDKTPSGQSITENDRVDLETFLVNEIRPIAPIFSRLETYKKKNIIMISVWEGANKPYYFRNNIYTRIGERTTISKDIAVSNLLIERTFSENRWERQAVLGASIDDLDLNEVRNSMTAYESYTNINLNSDIEEFLINTGLIVNGNVTNACIVLFGKNPTQFIPQSKIKLVVHPGTAPGDAFYENRMYQDNVFQNIRLILSDLDSIIGRDIKIDGILRKEQKLYPEKALREGLLNAIVHRDYSVSKAFLTISVFSDRLVISNYGGLPDELTVRDLKTEHNSILRNPDIAQMCFYNDLIEMLGTGTLRMIRSCKVGGFKIPIWKNKDNILDLTFPEIKHRFEGVNEGVKLNVEGVNEGVKLNIEGVNEGMRLEIENLFHIISKNPGKKASELNEQINKSVASTERYLKILREYGLIEFIGAPKTGGYYIK